MNTFQKIKKYLDENNIPHKYEVDDSFNSIRIWTSINSYYWVRIYKKQTVVKARTVITDLSFDTCKSVYTRDKRISYMNLILMLNKKNINNELIKYV